MNKNRPHFPFTSCPLSIEDLHEAISLVASYHYYRFLNYFNLTKHMKTLIDVDVLFQKAFPQLTQKQNSSLKQIIQILNATNYLETQGEFVILRHDVQQFHLMNKEKLESLIRESSYINGLNTLMTTLLKSYLDWVQGFQENVFLTHSPLANFLFNNHYSLAQELITSLETVFTDFPEYVKSEMNILLLDPPADGLLTFLYDSELFSNIASISIFPSQTKIKYLEYLLALIKRKNLSLPSIHLLNPKQMPIPPLTEQFDLIIGVDQIKWMYHHLTLGILNSLLEHHNILLQSIHAPPHPYSYFDPLHHQFHEFTPLTPVFVRKQLLKIQGTQVKYYSKPQLLIISKEKS